MEAGDVHQLDHGALDGTRVAPLRRDRHLDIPRPAANRGGDVDLEVGRRGRPGQRRVDRGTKGRWGQAFGEVDEVLLEGRSVDREQPSSGGVDPHDVVIRIDDNDADCEIEEQSFRRRGRRRSALDILAGGLDGLVEGASPKVGRPGKG